MLSEPFGGVIKVRVPEALKTTVRHAAAADMRTVSEYARAALLKELRAGGFDPAATPSKGTIARA